MATCAVLNASGALELTSDPVSACAGYVLLDASEYTLQTTMAGLVAMPDASDVGAVFAIGFSIPITLALIGWAVGSVLSPIGRR
ncbi:MAG: hypothetical protein QM739_04055 [Propionivibrio sp.]